MIYNKLKFLFLFFSVVLLSCRTTPHSTSDNVASVVYKADKIVFEYHDASVPPDDHRSYVITLNPDKLIYVVDSYGEIIKRVEEIKTRILGMATGGVIGPQGSFPPEKLQEVQQCVVELQQELQKVYGDFVGIIENGIKKNNEVTITVCRFDLASSFHSG